MIKEKEMFYKNNIVKYKSDIVEDIYGDYGMNYLKNNRYRVVKKYDKKNLFVQEIGTGTHLILPKILLCKIQK